MGRENILKVSAAEPEKVAVDEKFVEILADFSEKLYVKASETNSGNLIFSPLSVMYALSLCANGAGGETLDEFESVLGADDISAMNNYLYTLTQNLEDTKESTGATRIPLKYRPNFQTLRTDTTPRKPNQSRSVIQKP